jgi:DNA polymerase-1
MPNKFIIIDGFSLVHRAFYALPPFTTKAGIPTNAAYGFSLMLLRLLEDEKPDYFAVAFDRAAPTFRHEEFKDYKATRKKMPDELRSQFPLIRQILEAFKIPIYELDGYEADDVIGTLACEAARKDFDVLIFTGDRDAFQLADENVCVMITRKGISETEKIGPTELKEKYGLIPGQIPDLKGLMGDTSDNIPGVPGIGEKTALRLLHEFQTIDNLLENKEQVSRPRERNLLNEYAEQALASKRLATICCDVPIEVDYEACRFSEPDKQAVIEVFKELEFNSLAARVSGGNAGAKDKGQTTAQAKDAAKGAAGDADSALTATAALRTIRPPDMKNCSAADLSTIVAQAKEVGDYAIQFWSLRTEWGHVEPFGLAVAAGEESYWLPLTNPATAVATLFSSVQDSVTPDALSSLFNCGARCWGHDLKSQFRILDAFGIEVQDKLCDTMIMGYLTDPSASGQSLENLCRRLLDAEPGGWRDPRGRFPDPLNPTDKVSADIYQECAGVRLAAVNELSKILVNELTRTDMLDLYLSIEAPLIRILFDMEKNGVAIDVPFLKNMGIEFGARINTLENQAYDLAGEQFNLNSPKQLGVILFEKLGLPAGKKTKTGYSTDAETLENLSGKHPLVDTILEYRSLIKLKSTYIDALPALVSGRTGRVHTTFNQAVTATGRLSSTDPNLQNIPIRTDEGERIRRAFIAGNPNWLIMTADYSQIELRVMAHLSQDPVLIDSFCSGEDIHRRSAAEIFGVPIEQVDDRLRDQAKAVNFGVIYGISGFGLAKGAGVSRKEAELFIERYFQRYQGVMRFIDETINQARENGYVTTMFKRRRYLPDLLAANRNIRAFAERTARNTPVQGSAADIIKVAMIRVDEKLKARQLQAKMLLQVHDELVFEVPPEEVDTVAAIVREAMENVCEFSVPLKVDIKRGVNWGEAKRH